LGGNAGKRHYSPHYFAKIHVKRRYTVSTAGIFVYTIDFKKRTTYIARYCLSPPSSRHSLECPCLVLHPCSQFVLMSHAGRTRDIQCKSSLLTKLLPSRYAVHLLLPARKSLILCEIYTEYTINREFGGLTGLAQSPINPLQLSTSLRTRHDLYTSSSLTFIFVVYLMRDSSSVKHIVLN
jgi:hypothetical protein